MNPIADGDFAETRTIGIEGCSICNSFVVFVCTSFYQVLLAYIYALHMLIVYLFSHHIPVELSAAYPIEYIYFFSSTGFQIFFPAYY